MPARKIGVSVWWGQAFLPAHFQEAGRNACPHPKQTELLPRCGDECPRGAAQPMFRLCTISEHKTSKVDGIYVIFCGAASAVAQCPLGPS